MASRGPKIKEEYIDTFLESISVTPNTKKIVTIDSEKLKLKIKQELAELAHRVAHRAGGGCPGYEYQEPIYQEIERRRRDMMTPPVTPIEQDFVQDAHFNLVFSKQEAAHSVLQARKASQPSQLPTQSASQSNERPPARSASTNDLFRDRFINKIAQFQRARSHTPTPITDTHVRNSGPQASQISSTGTRNDIKNENVRPETLSTTQRFRSKILRRTSSRSSASSVSPLKKAAGGDRKEDINITIDLSSQLKDRKIRLGTEQGGVNIKFTSSSPIKDRKAAVSPRKPTDCYVPNYEMENMRLRGDARSDGNVTDKDSDDEEAKGRPTRPRPKRGESLWDYIAANC